MIDGVDQPTPKNILRESLLQPAFCPSFFNCRSHVLALKAFVDDVRCSSAARPGSQKTGLSKASRFILSSRFFLPDQGTALKMFRISVAAVVLKTSSRSAIESR